MSNSFFDTEDIIEGPQETSFFDEKDIQQESSGEKQSNLETLIKPLPQVTQPQAALTGAQQGLTMGFADELGGMTQSGLDRFQRLLNEYTGLVGKSPTQISEELAQQGFQGDLGPTSSDELYKEATAEGRRELAASEEQHPWTTGLTDVASSMLIPGAAIGKIAKAPKAISKLDKVRKGAATGMGVGALEAAGRTEEDISSPEGREDVAMGASLGGLFGAGAGKVSQKLEPKALMKKADDLAEQAEDAALRSSGITPKEMSEQIEKQTKTGELTGPGTFGLEEGIIDPFIKPKGSYLKAKEVKNRLSQSYDNLTKSFAGKSNLGEAQARDLAERKADEVMEAVGDALSKTDDLSEGAERKIRNDLDTLKEELVQAYTSDNPVKELQDLYVVHNDKFFSNASSASSGTQARKALRNKLKELQRDYVKVMNPDAYDEFAKLDDQYSKVLDLEQITLREAGKEPTAGGISDISRGLTARVLTGIPGIEVPVIAGNVLAKTTFGKDAGKILQTLGAKRALNKSDRLKELAGEIPRKGLKESIDEVEGTIGKMKAGTERIRRDVTKPLYTAIEKSPTTTTSTSVAGGSALAGAMTKDDQKLEPYQLHRRTAKMAERATPESLTQQAQSIREKYGEEGERLAMTLEKMADRDIAGRRALMFHLLQNPMYKKMMMDNEK